jgi:hypothetical protein
LLDRPKPTAGCSASGRRRRIVRCTETFGSACISALQPSTFKYARTAASN